MAAVSPAGPEPMMISFSFGISTPQSLFVYLLFELFTEIRHRLRQPPQGRASEQMPLRVHRWFAARVVRVSGITLSARVAAFRAVARGGVGRKTVWTNVQHRSLARQGHLLSYSPTMPAF